MAPTDGKLTCVLRSRVTDSRGVDSHVSGTPQAGSRDQVTPLQVYTPLLCPWAAD